jgi:hypothetical protein
MNRKRTTKTKTVDGCYNELERYRRNFIGHMLLCEYLTNQQLKELSGPVITRKMTEEEKIKYGVIDK